MSNILLLATWKDKIYYCGSCGSCGSCGGGKAKIIFGKAFKRVCECTFRIDNAGKNNLPFLKNGRITNKRDKCGI